jgi:hypothetical protein
MRRWHKQEEIARVGLKDMVQITDSFKLLAKVAIESS